MGSLEDFKAHNGTSACKRDGCTLLGALCRALLRFMSVKFALSKLLQRKRIGIYIRRKDDGRCNI